MIVNKYANGNGGGGGTGSTITVDAALSSSSTNPVENRVITNALSEYTTNEYVESRFDAAEAYTDSQVNNLEEALSAAITAATEDLASTQYVDDAIAGIVIPEPPEDYATTGDVANAVEGLASESYVDGAISTATEHMVTTDDLQDYATEQYVDDAVNGLSQGIGMLGMVNNVSESNGTVTVMKTTMQEGQLVTGSTSFDIVTSGDVATAITAATENLATEQYVDDAIADMATTQYVDDAISATEAYVDGEITAATHEIYEYVDAAILTGATITVDDALSTASTNPVENRVIANKFGDYYTKAETDAEITAATQNFVTSGDVTTAITSATQNFITSGDVQTIVDDAVATAITVDSALSSSSTNPVENQAIYKELYSTGETSTTIIIPTQTQAWGCRARGFNSSDTRVTNKYISGYTTNVENVIIFKVSDADDDASVTYFTFQYFSPQGTTYLYPEQNVIVDSSIENGFSITMVGSGDSLVTVDKSSLGNSFSNYVLVIDASANKLYVYDNVNNAAITNISGEGLEKRIEDKLDEKQDKLVSGTNIKTINSTSLIGRGNIAIYAPSTSGQAGQFPMSTGLGQPSWSTYKFAFITQTQYDALTTKDANTIYFIVGN